MAVDDPPAAFEYVGLARRTGVLLVDLPLAMVIWWGFSQLNALAVAWRSFAMVAVSAAACHVLWWTFVTTFGGTPGKLLLGMRIVDAEGRYLGWAGAMLRDMPYLPWTAIDLVMWWKIMRALEAGRHAGESDPARLWALYAGNPWYASAAVAIGVAGFIDVLTILTNHRRRALHDYFAGSFVVTEESLPGGR